LTSRKKRDFFSKKYLNNKHYFYKNNGQKIFQNVFAKKLPPILTPSLQPLPSCSTTSYPNSQNFLPPPKVWVELLSWFRFKYLRKKNLTCNLFLIPEAYRLRNRNCFELSHFRETARTTIIDSYMPLSSEIWTKAIT